MQLAAHHVEVLFVLSALLGGRRKRGFQQVMLFPSSLGEGGGGREGGSGGEGGGGMEGGSGGGGMGVCVGGREGGMGLMSVLDAMWERMSWGKASHHYHTLGAMATTMLNLEEEEEEDEEEDMYPEEGEEEEEEEEEEEDEMPPAQAHLHGPNCECTTDSALRVQFLRTLHNALEPDWEEDEEGREEGEGGREGGVRRLMVSEEEWARMKALGEGGGEGAVVGSGSCSSSLLSKLIEVGMKGGREGKGGVRMRAGNTQKSLPPSLPP